jgi:hypothetical protein
MKLLFIRYSKLFFIRLQLHRVFGLFEGLLETLLYLTRFSRWASQQKKQLPNDFPSKWDYDKRYPLYEKVLAAEVANEPVNYLEFGVAYGQSFRWFMQQQRHPDSRFHGFDTFDGLPEDWGHYKKGMFSNNMQAPVIDDARGKFYTGLFQQTLPGFLQHDFDPSRKNIIMMDADLYSATLYVLTLLAPFLKKGDIIFFDEFVVPTHEFKAYLDFIQSYYLNLELIGAANNYYFAAFKVTG